MSTLSYLLPRRTASIRPTLSGARIHDFMRGHPSSILPAAYSESESCPVLEASQPSEHGSATVLAPVSNSDVSSLRDLSNI